MSEINYKPGGALYSGGWEAGGKFSEHPGTSNYSYARKKLILHAFHGPPCGRVVHEPSLGSPAAVCLCCALHPSPRQSVVADYPAWPNCASSYSCVCCKHTGN